MKITALIPVKQFELSKTRLELTKNQRNVLTELMLKSTILNLKKCKSINTIVTISADEKVETISKYYNVKFIFSKEKGVNYAVELGDDYCKENLVNTNIVVPRMDGTNLLIRQPFNLYETSYDNNSYCNHIQSSRKTGARTIVVKSVNLAEDLDTMEDYERITAHPINKLSRLISRIPTVI